MNCVIRAEVKNCFLWWQKQRKTKGAEKFYICVGSLEETIAFYFAMGCEETKEINQNLFYTITT